MRRRPGLDRVKLGPREFKFSEQSKPSVHNCLGNTEFRAKPKAPAAGRAKQGKVGRRKAGWSEPRSCGARTPGLACRSR